VLLDGKFAEESGKFAHVGEDHGPGSFQSVRWGEAAGISKDAHACRARGLDTVPAVFDHGAFRGIDVHLLGRVQKEVGGGLAVSDLANAEDPACEALIQAGQPQRVADFVVAAAGCHTDRHGDASQGFNNAVNQSELRVERLPVQVLESLFPIVGKTPSQMGFDLGDHVRVGASDEALDHLIDADRPAECVDHSGINADGNAFAVDEYPVAVEDDEFPRSSHSSSLAAPAQDELAVAPLKGLPVQIEPLNCKLSDPVYKVTRMTNQGIVAESLIRRFGDVVAVDGVDVQVQPGEIYGFLGPNGAGKSTTIRMLCTLLSPSAGRAMVAGHDVAGEPEQVRLRIGVALQDTALDPKQTGTELLRLQGRLYGLSRREIDVRIRELSELIELGDAIDRLTSTYSGGMKRRLDLAAALIHNPEVLFLDEPTSGLDPVSRAKVWQEVRALNEELGMTIFLTTQYLEEADALANRVGIIDRGRLAAEGTPDELKRTIGADVIVVHFVGDTQAALDATRRVPGVSEVEARGNEVTISVEDGAATISPVAVALNGCAITVRDLTLRRPTLDDVFLELTGGRIQEDGSDG